MQYLVVAYLSDDALNAFAQMSTISYKLCTSEELWRIKYILDFGVTTLPYRRYRLQYSIDRLLIPFREVGERELAIFRNYLSEVKKRPQAVCSSPPSYHQDAKHVVLNMYSSRLPLNLMPVWNKGSSYVILEDIAILVQGKEIDNVYHYQIQVLERDRIECLYEHYRHQLDVSVFSGMNKAYLLHITDLESYLDRALANDYYPLDNRQPLYIADGNLRRCIYY